MKNPNVNKLIARKMAIDAIPAGGGLGDGLRFLASAESIMDGHKKAKEWVEQAIAAVKGAPDNPYGDDDEVIAAEILRRINERKGL